MKSKFLVLKLLLVVVASGFLGFYLFLQFKISKITPYIKEEFRVINLTEKSPFKQLILSAEFNQEIKGKNIIGFGEATHGTVEFRESFCELARELIINNKCNTMYFCRTRLRRFLVTE